MKYYLGILNLPQRPPVNKWSEELNQPKDGGFEGSWCQLLFFFLYPLHHYLFS